MQVIRPCFALTDRRLPRRCWERQCTYPAFPHSRHVEPHWLLSGAACIVHVLYRIWLAALFGMAPPHVWAGRRAFLLPASRVSAEHFSCLFHAGDMEHPLSHSDFAEPFFLGPREDCTFHLSEWIHFFPSTATACHAGTVLQAHYASFFLLA